LSEEEKREQQLSSKNVTCEICEKWWQI